MNQIKDMLAMKLGLKAELFKLRGELEAAKTKWAEWMERSHDLQIEAKKYCAERDSALASLAGMREALIFVHEIPCALQRCAERDGSTGCKACIAFSSPDSSRKWLADLKASVWREAQKEVEGRFAEAHELRNLFKQRAEAAINEMRQSAIREVEGD
ncbi:MAG: hypothetical protein QME60_08405 [Verrucomicrobiota bacterium]|nr:hypothetical protein [Verrucomicrobiota bacterium]